MKKFSFFLLVFLILTACSHKANLKIEIPELPSKIGKSQVGETLPFQNASHKEKFCADWWEEFDDPLLEKLINKTLSHNFDLKIASFKLKEAESLYHISKASLYPSLSLTHSTSLTYLKTKPPMATSHYQKEFQTGLSVSYEIDLWGKLRNQKQANLMKFLSEKWNRKALQIELISQVITNYYKFLYLVEKEKLLQKEKALLEKKNKVLALKYENGELPIENLKRNKARIYSLKINLENLEKEKTNTLSTLKLLTGSLNLNEPLFTSQNLLTLKVSPLPSNLPSSILKNRPDVMRVYFLLKSSNYTYLASLADRFPSLTLTGFAGFKSEELSEALKPDNFLWNLAFNTGLILFNRGRIKENIKLNKYKVMETASLYGKTLYNAFLEVERGLTSEEVLKKNLSLCQKILKNDKELYSIAVSKYIAGEKNLLNVIDQEIQVLKDLQACLDIKFSYLMNRIFLYKALGGKRPCVEK